MGDPNYARFQRRHKILAIQSPFEAFGQRPLLDGKCMCPYGFYQFRQGSGDG